MEFITIKSCFQLAQSNQARLNNAAFDNKQCLAIDPCRLHIATTSSGGWKNDLLNSMSYDDFFSAAQDVSHMTELAEFVSNGT